jgi:Fe2+ transport system protein FeoA
MSPLNSIAPGRKVRVVRIPGIRCRFMDKVQEIGLAPGSTIDVLANDGDVIDLGIGSSEIKIGPALASGIYVRSVE